MLQLITISGGPLTQWIRLSQYRTASANSRRSSSGGKKQSLVAESRRFSGLTRSRLCIPNTPSPPCHSDIGLKQTRDSSSGAGGGYSIPHVLNLGTIRSRKKAGSGPQLLQLLILNGKLRPRRALIARYENKLWAIFNAQHSGGRAFEPTSRIPTSDWLTPSLDPVRSMSIHRRLSAASGSSPGKANFPNPRNTK